MFDHQQNVNYTAAAMILDADDPSKVIARSDKPLLAPETEDEMSGIVPNVVFPTAIEKIGEQLFVFYGMADSKSASPGWTGFSPPTSATPASRLTPDKPDSQGATDDEQLCPLDTTKNDHGRRRDGIDALCWVRKGWPPGAAPAPGTATAAAGRRKGAAVQGRPPFRAILCSA